MLGIWWPYWFEWEDYKIWDSTNWFTFGVGFLAVIFMTRILISDDDDRYSIANTIIISPLCIGGCLLYGKSALLYAQGSSNEIFCLGMTHLKLAILITIIVWLFNFVCSNKYDNAQSNNPLGGNP
jgi:hypothetical protein